MRPWRFLLFILLISFTFEAFPAVFVVTSNADSGPGTLREALTKATANGNATTDYINFNLPDHSEAGRTIKLLTQLPGLSSNLVLDGTTQPGAVFGISSAKVALFYQSAPGVAISALTASGESKIEIYGLYIKDLSEQDQIQSIGIDLFNDKDVIIGAAHKGNVVCGFLYPLWTNKPHEQDTRFFENLTLKNNFFGFEPDGETMPANQAAAINVWEVVGSIIIGGTPEEGNLTPGGIYIFQVNSEDYTDPEAYYISTPATLLIKNNNIGIDHAEQFSIPKCSGINISVFHPNGKNTVRIEDNVIASDVGNALFAINNGGPITLLRNYIGTNRARSKTFTTLGIFLYWSSAVAIGSSNPADANYITNCNPIQIWPYTYVTVNKNSIYCTVGARPMHDEGAGYQFPYPKIDILNISTTSVSGTATPNSTVELFYSDVCKTCSPQTYFASTTTDANGKWKYNGNIAGTVIASATLGKATSDFTKTTVNVDNVKIVHSCTTDGTGSIIGAIPQSAANMTWVDEQGNIVGHKADLLNVKQGKYKLIVHNGDCTDSTPFFEIKQNFEVNTTDISMHNPSCNNPLGSITGVYVISNTDGITNIKWKDAGGQTVSNDINLQNIPAGSYYLSASSADGSCTETFGPFKLVNTTGPNVDQTTAHVQPTNCGQSTGSITNITVTGTGTLKYIWWNSNQQQVAITKDLTGQPRGVYKLQVTDDTQCGPVYTTDITIPETNGITLDESNVTTSIASCSQNNGSIKGISFTGATKFQWMDANNNVVSSTADFTGAAPGVYIFTASNNFGCSKSSQPYTVGQQPPVQLPQYAAITVASCFGGKNGSVTVATDALVKTLHWVDGQGAPAGDQPSLTNVGAGTYKLYITDQNGCENLYNTYTVEEVPEFKVASIGQTVNDQCGLNTGNVNNVNITGGVPPYTYKWTDAAGKPIGTESSISNLAAGNYVLNVVDTRCGNVYIPYTITEESAEVAAPSVSDIQLCSSGGALLSINNASPAITYRLYETENSAHQVDEQKGGKFSISVSANRSYFVTQLNGTCESPRAEVKITVGLSALNIANTFTPNGDGINDYWKISNIESYPNALVQVFSRYGQKVFESKGYAKPFDGTMNGKKLPPGVYYYIINLNTNCNVLSGSLTIIR